MKYCLYDTEKEEVISTDGAVAWNTALRCKQRYNYFVRYSYEGKLPFSKQTRVIVTEVTLELNHAPKP